MPPLKNGTHVNYTNRGVKGGKRTPYLRISAGPLRGQYVHVLVAEAMLGRKLDPETEEVDHVDGNGLNPVWSNLEIVTPAVNRKRMHARLKAAKNARVRKQRWERKMKKLVAAGQVQVPEHVTRFDSGEFV